MSTFVPFTGFEDCIPEDQPGLYLTTGEGNLRGVQEIHVHLFEPDGDDRPLGWISVDTLRAALEVEK